ncbi:unnamed protein product, partial [Ectocarpus sp. 8 AP-2014]
RQPQSPDLDGVRNSEALLQSSPPGERVSSGMLPLKRFRVSASPATGLVGMEENVFLSDFFGCVGFLPLTTQSHIRETMVEMMTAPAPLQQPAIAGSWNEETRFSEVERGANCRKASDVEKYSQLAQEALPKSVSGPADAEVAK